MADTKYVYNKKDGLWHKTDENDVIMRLPLSVLNCTGFSVAARAVDKLGEGSLCPKCSKDETPHPELVAAAKARRAIRHAPFKSKRPSK